MKMPGRKRTPVSITLFAHEGEMARLERINKRIASVAALEALALVVTVAVFQIRNGR